jgi:hypothetical protein
MIDNGSHPPLSAEEAKDARKVVRWLVDVYGRELYDKSNQMRFSGLLSDFFAADEGLRRVMKTAIGQHLPSKILQCLDEEGVERNISLKALRAGFKNDNHLEYVVVDKVINILAWGVGIDTKGGRVIIGGTDGTDEQCAAMKIGFIAARKKGLFSPDRWIVELNATDKLPCDLFVLVGEGVVESNPQNYKPVRTIGRDELISGGSQTFELEYKKRDKKKKLIFRIVPSSPDYREEVEVIPEIKTIAR